MTKLGQKLIELIGPTKQQLRQEVADLRKDHERMCRRLYDANNELEAVKDALFFAMSGVVRAKMYASTGLITEFDSKKRAIARYTETITQILKSDTWKWCFEPKKEPT